MEGRGAGGTRLAQGGGAGGAGVTESRRVAAELCADLRRGELLDPAFDARSARLDARDRRWT